MKNSRRSDRELAKTVGVSQPTVSRAIERLEKEGYIKEYTMIPDFAKLGYQIMVITFAQTLNPQTDGSSLESRKAVAETEDKQHFANLMGVKGIGLGKYTVFLTFYRSYSAYTEAMQIAKQIPHLDLDSFESFMVDLNDKNNYRVLTMAQIARHVLSPE